MGVVYKALDLRLKRVVALKMILNGTASSQADTTRFLNEAETIARLQHPNLVQIYDVGVYEGRPYFALEFVDGPNLGVYLHGEPLSPREAAELVQTLAHAVHAVHSRGIVHRDLKPANILLQSETTINTKQGTAEDIGHAEKKEQEARLIPNQGESGNSSSASRDSHLFRGFYPKLTDFGLAKKLDSTTGQTATGDILGTPLYMAPEQAAGKTREIGTPVDIYALGTILYELLTGKPPFWGETGWEVVQQVISAEAVPPSRRQGKVPRDLETICLKCLEKEPRKRYASADALAEDLRRFLAGEPILARPVGPMQRLIKWGRRRPALASLALVSVLATVALGVGGVLHNLELQAALKEAHDRGEEGRQRLVRLHVARGVQQMDQGDWLGALVWLTEALRLDQGEPAREELHRLRLGALLSQCPNLAALWFHDGPVQHACFSADGGRTLTVSDDGTARVWDVQTGHPATPPLRHTAALVYGEFSRDGRRVVTMTATGDAQVWDAKSGKAITPVLSHGTRGTLAAFSPDGEALATLSHDNVVRLWDAGTGKPLQVTFVHAKTVHWFVFSPDGTHLASACQDGAAHLWDLKNGKETVAPLQHGSPVRKVAFSPDGRRVLTVGADCKVRQWDATRGTELCQPLKHFQNVNHAAFSPDGRWIVTASDDKRARLWNAGTGELRGPTLKHPADVNIGSFSPDGRWVVTACDDNTTRLWEADNSEPVPPWLLHHGTVHQATFSPDGRYLLTASCDCTARLWDLQRVLERSTLHLDERAEGKLRPDPAAPRLNDPERLQAKSPDGQLIVKVEGKNTARVWKADGAEAITPPLRHGSMVLWVCFSPDGRTVATASDDNTTRLWDAQTGRLLLSPLQHESSINHVAFSPDGRLVLTSARDGTARVWSTRTGEALTHPLQHPRAVIRGKFDADGRRIQTTDAANVTITWDLRCDDRPVEELLRLARCLAGCQIDAERGSLPVEVGQLRALWEQWQK
jgi:WD40 repeat protein/tRNA A-37 threonylcarbamoyl transferase component Bud32